MGVLAEAVETVETVTENREEPATVDRGYAAMDVAFNPLDNDLRRRAAKLL